MVALRTELRVCILTGLHSLVPLTLSHQPFPTTMLTFPSLLISPWKLSSSLRRALDPKVPLLPSALSGQLSVLFHLQSRGGWRSLCPVIAPLWVAQEAAQMCTPSCQRALQGLSRLTPSYLATSSASAAAQLLQRSKIISRAPQAMVPAHSLWISPDDVLVCSRCRILIKLLGYRMQSKIRALQAWPRGSLLLGANVLQSLTFSTAP